MVKRVEEMENSATGKRSLEEKLREYPVLRARIEMLLGVVENAAGDAEKADEAERRAIEELRQMGSEVLQGWAEKQHKNKVEKLVNKKGVCRKGKKKSIGTLDLEKSK